jgi:hypothetical protein
VVIKVITDNAELNTIFTINNAFLTDIYSLLM